VKKKRVMIVFEETGEDGVDSHGMPGAKFNVFLEGDIKAILDGVPEDQRSAAEFWGHRMFGIVKKVMEQANVVDKKCPHGHPPGRAN
jgi:hypothetical protein